ncbi:MAG: outer membrane beta-barrel protein, partial [Candidatus Goldiibacteriota bacterium]
IADDASAAFYNPAGTVKLTGLELMAETYMLSFGRSINYVATADPFYIGKSLYALGFSWINYSSGSDVQARLTNSDTPDSLIGQSSNLFLFNVSTALSERLSIGGNFKFFSDSLDKYTGTGVGFDLGAIYKVIDGLNAAVDISNISSNITWNLSAHIDTPPQTITAGISYEYRDIFGIKGISILPAADFVFDSYAGFEFKCGAELDINRIFYMRAGYNNGFTAGAGLKLKPSDHITLNIDYAYFADEIDPDSNSQRIGASIIYVMPTWGVQDKNPLIRTNMYDW